MVGWLAGWLARWLDGWYLVGWLVGWLVGRMDGWWVVGWIGGLARGFTPPPTHLQQVVNETDPDHSGAAAHAAEVIGLNIFREAYEETRHTSR